MMFCKNSNVHILMKTNTTLSTNTQMRFTTPHSDLDRFRDQSRCLHSNKDAAFEGLFLSSLCGSLQKQTRAPERIDDVKAHEPPERTDDDVKPTSPLNERDGRRKGALKKRTKEKKKKKKKKKKNALAVWSGADHNMSTRPNPEQAQDIARRRE
uniref:Uncharacterized protein n=1 Tax=Bionectria ochroleuca TaxID=29856 RepID=A0A8H7K2K9_BIOOC